MTADQIGAAFIILVLFREFTVTSIRLVAAENGKVVAANMWGKAKTVSQMIAVIVVLLNGYIVELMGMGILNISADTAVFSMIDTILLWISAVLTVISGIIYIKDNFQFIKTAK